MQKAQLLLLALGVTVWVHRASAATISQDFTADPLQNGWTIFGRTNLFHWNSADRTLEVTWDSSQSNSYFYHPLGTTLTRSDDFRVDFDLLLRDAVSGTEPGKTGGLEIGIGFLNAGIATSSNYMRGSFGGAPSLVELDYFPAGYYVFGGTVYDVAATTTPTFISTNSLAYAPTIFAPYEFQLPTNILIHVTMVYTATNQVLVTQLTTNGLPLVALPNVALTDSQTSGFAQADDYRVDAFSINSYSSAGDDFDSVLAHGSIGNIVVTYPEPIRDFTGSFSNSVWQGQFLSRSNWVYALERSSELGSWAQVSPNTAGNAATLVLQDTNPPAAKAFYRVRANLP